mgnify:CR=1 FL=1
MSKLRSDEIIAKENGESREKVRRYVRLTYLIPELLKLVDNSVIHDKRTYLTIGLKPAVELSYLTKEEQKLLYSTFIYDDLTPSHGQAIKIRELSKKKQLNYNTLCEILSESKGNQNEQISFNKDKIESVLPSDLLKRDKRYIEQYIINAILKYKELEKEKIAEKKETEKEEGENEVKLVSEILKTSFKELEKKQVTIPGNIIKEGIPRAGHALDRKKIIEEFIDIANSISEDEKNELKD